MPSLPKLEHVGIYVPRDKFETAISFYVDVFGWHVIRRQGETIAFVGDGSGGRLEILAGDEPPLPKPHHLAFVLPMDQLDAAIEALSATDAQLNPVTITPAGDKLLFFFDPAGTYVQIVCRVNAMEP
jgi:catechol 2,3-dioxygenase-like lactoylglutathione lyase family enzyme